MSAGLKERGYVIGTTPGLQSRGAKEVIRREGDRRVPAVDGAVARVGVSAGREDVVS